MKTIERHTLFAALSLAAALLLSGCTGTLQSDENGITIEHSSHEAGLAQWKADKHCEQYGKKAVLVRKSPNQTTYLLQTNVSEFECVAPGSAKAQ